MRLPDTLVRPLVTEKSTTRLGLDRTYGFVVNREANKKEIATAVEQHYGVKVATVRTVIVRGKNKRFGRHYGRRPNWKKAYVTLAQGHSINFFEA
jgi:large subunit ribosomal protein L23